MKHQDVTMSRMRKLPSPDDPQYDLFGGMPASLDDPVLQTAVHSGRRFLTGDASAIFLRTMRLEEHLKRSGQHAPLTVARLLGTQDWKAFERRYAATDHAPYAPQSMVGLILYGVMHGVHSLRELERLARLDLGCMWVTGGIAPDHANIGRFIIQHEASLTLDFFESLTSAILKVTGSGSARLAGDGTVIEAACSHYKLLKEEADKARATFDIDPSSETKVIAVMLDQSTHVTETEVNELLLDAGYFDDDVIAAKSPYYARRASGLPRPKRRDGTTRARLAMTRIPILTDVPLARL